ncbi:hypothetical protein [Streptomyces sp. NPDC091215]|uniref:hypothetical protein n=1 Tax=Streptomyces sp. NPDC091215 TaxID=3155192 RepID=UPI00342CB60A
MRPELKALAALDIDPTTLESAPAGPPRTTDYRARINPGPEQRPCSSCGTPAISTQVVDVPEIGLRWHDQCRDCMIYGLTAGWT